MGDVCAAERCDSPASVLRWCRRHYDRQRKYGSADATPASEIRGWSRASESDKIVDLVAVDQVISGRRVSLNIHERRVAARRMVNDLGWTAKQAAETIGVQVAAVFRYLKEPDAEGVVYCGLSAEGYADAEGGR